LEYGWGSEMALLVEARNLSKSYSAGGSIVRAVSDISISIKRGDYVAVTGRSGSGKTSLMNLLGLLERPDLGSYAFNGREVTTLSDDQRAAIRNREIGFVFQLPALLPRASAEQNVELPLIYAGVRSAKRRHMAKEALDRVGLAHRSHHWPYQLSGGEQQRVATARAIVNDPALVLADEPTGALDSRTSDEMLSLFAELHKDGRTIVVVTHAPDVADRASRLVSMHDGRITEDAAVANASNIYDCNERH
jgi:putative ABC transport system ATP-binding protein